MNRKQRNRLGRILIATLLTGALLLLGVEGWVGLGLYLTVYLIIGHDILRKAGLGMVHGRMFDENFLMTIATIGAFVLAIYDGNGDFVEGVAVMLFYQIGEFFQRRVNFIVSALGAINPTEFAVASATIDIDTEVVPYRLDNLDDKVSTAVKAVSGGVWSQRHGVMFVGNLDRIDSELAEIKEEQQEKAMKETRQ